MEKKSVENSLGAGVGSARDGFAARLSGVRKGAHIAILSVVVLFVYANSLDAPFIFDDAPTITLNERIRADNFSFEDIVSKPVSGYSGHSRPVPMITFAVNYLFGGLNPFGYRMFNMVVHVLVAVFLYLLVFETLMLALPRGTLDANPRLPDSVAFWNAMIWTLNPLQVLSVTYVCQRMNSMAALFSLAAIFFYVKGRSRWRESDGGGGNALSWCFYVFSVVSVVLALGSKQNAITTPLFIFLYEWFFFRGLDGGWMKRWLFRVLAPLSVVVAVAAFLWMGENPWRTLLGSYAGRDFTLWERLLTECRVVFHYAGLYVLPLPSWTRLVYDYRISTSLFSPPSTFLAVSALAGCAVWCVISAKRYPLAVFCVAWWFGQLVVESSVIGLEPMYEYRVYAPSMFLLLVPLCALFGMRGGGRFAKAARYAVPAVLAIVYAVFTMERNDLMSRPLAFWSDARTKSPKDERVGVNYANALIARGDRRGAEAILREVLKRHPDMVEAMHNLGAILAGEGRYAEAETLLRRVLSLEKNYTQARVTLAAILIDTGRLEEAERHLEYARTRQPENPLIDAHFGDLELRKGRRAEAVEFYKKALSRTPVLRAFCNLATIYMDEGDLSLADNLLLVGEEAYPASARIRYLRGVLAMRGGDARTAMIHFRNALVLDPGFSDARRRLDLALNEAKGHGMEIDACLKSLAGNPDDCRTLLRLGKLFLSAGRANEAIPRFERVLDLDSESLESLKGLGDAMIMLRRYSEAEGYYALALSKAPSNAVLHHNLGSSMAYQGKFEAAAEHYREALRLNPGYKEAEVNLRRVMSRLRRTGTGGGGASSGGR